MRHFLTFPEQVIAEICYMPVGIMGDAALNAIQPFFLRNKTNRPDKFNDNTTNKSLRDKGTRNRRARSVCLAEQQGGRFVQAGRRDLQLRGFWKGLSSSPSSFSKVEGTEGPGSHLPSAALAGLPPASAAGLRLLLLLLRVPRIKSGDPGAGSHLRASGTLPVVRLQEDHRTP